MRITLITSSDARLAHGKAHDALAVASARIEAEAVRFACAKNGWEATVVEARPDLPRTIEELARSRPDVVFHLAGSVRGDTRLEAAVAWMLEWSGIPHTGSGPATISIAREKPLARAMLRDRNVGVPIGFVLEHAEQSLPPAFRENVKWVVKPSRESASHGIGMESVVQGTRALRNRVAYVIETYSQPALVEEYVEGREFHVAILGSRTTTQMLPLAEIDFSKHAKEAPRLVTYASRWIEPSADYGTTPAVPVHSLHAELDRAVRGAALAAYHALDLAGYGCVDLRLDTKRGPLVLDVNSNPDLSPTAELARAAERGGLSYAELIARIVAEALHAAPVSAGTLAR